MTSLLAYLSKSRRLGRENLASGVFAFILDNSPKARFKFASALMKHFNLELPDDFQIDTQVTDESGSRPDIDLSANKEIIVRIECKFGAGFTCHQEDGSYLNCLAEKGLLLFVVPSTRRPEVRDWLRGKYGLNLSHRQQGKIDEKTVAIVTWNELLKFISFEEADLQDRRYELYFDDLKSLCGVEKTMAFTPISPDQLSSEQGAFFSDLLSIVFDIAEEWISPRSKGIFGRAWSDSSTGRDGEIAGFGCWIGLETKRWKESNSPIWLWFSRETNIPSKLAGSGIKVETDLDYGDFWIPIKLAPNVHREELMELIGEQIYKIEESLRSAP